MRGDVEGVGFKVFFFCSGSVSICEPVDFKIVMGGIKNVKTVYNAPGNPRHVNHIEIHALRKVLEAGRVVDGLFRYDEGKVAPVAKDGNVLFGIFGAKGS